MEGGSQGIAEAVVSFCGLLFGCPSLRFFTKRTDFAILAFELVYQGIYQMDKVGKAPGLDSKYKVVKTRIQFYTIT